MGFGLGVAKAHSAVMAAKDVALAEHAAVKIARQVVKRLLALTDSAAIGDPQ
jgi:hypothetical protein